MFIVFDIYDVGIFLYVCIICFYGDAMKSIRFLEDGKEKHFHFNIDENRKSWVKIFDVKSGNAEFFVTSNNHNYIMNNILNICSEKKAVFF